MSSAARWGGLRLDPYNPKAFDADGDGIVQEGTAFERPVDMRIVDEFGRDLLSGITSNTRSSNWRVVDKDGNAVDYVPTYQRTPSQPVSNFVGTIGSRVGTIGDRVGTIGDRVQTLDKTVGTLVSLPETRQDIVASAASTISEEVGMPTGISEYVEVASGPQEYNLPIREGQVLPDEMSQPPDMEKVSELISVVDGSQQIVPRAIASAFYQNDFSWLADQFAFDAGGYAHMGGDAQPVEGLSLADMAYVMSVFREDAQASARRVADDNGMVRVFRGGPISQTDEPVSVSLDRSDAEEFGDVFEYLVPVEAFEYEPPAGSSYAAEFLVNPNMMQQQAQNDEGIDTPLSKIIDSGGSDFARPDDQYVQKIKDSGWSSRLFSLETKDETSERRTSSHKRILSELRTAINDADIPSEGYMTISKEANEFGLDSWSIRVHRDIAEKILNSSDEEILEELSSTAQSFAEGIDRRVRVQIPSGKRLDTFLSEGRYKTTHEVASDHSSTDIRKEYEVTLGIPPDASADLRPVSGYIVHPEFSSSSSVGRGVEIYGDVTLILKDDVADRSAFGRGDSLNTGFKPVRIGDADSDAILNAISLPGGKDINQRMPSIIALLEASRTDSFEGLPNRDGGSADDDAPIRDYFEALIPGGFTVEDVEELVLPFEGAATSEQTDDEIIKNVSAEFFSEEFLRQYGFTDAEILQAGELIGRVSPINQAGGGRDRISQMFVLVSPTIGLLLNYRQAKTTIQSLEDRGIRVSLLGRDAERLTPDFYNVESEGSIETALKDRIAFDIKGRLARLGIQRVDPEEESEM